MQKTVAEKKLQPKDLWPIGVVLVAVLIQTILFTPSAWQTIILVLGLAYGQNIGLTLSARSRTRNNVLYHFCAVLLSSFVLFVTFQTIMGSAANFPLELLLAYVAGTISGSLTGAFAAMWVERLTGARMEEVSKDEANKNQERNQKIAFRVFPAVLIVGWSLQFLFFPNESVWPLLLVMGVVFFPDMAYSMRTWIQNRDNYYLTLGMGLLTGIVDFFRWTYLIKFEMRWDIFVPYASGGTGGSIAGSFAASRLTRLVEWITGTKSSVDAHVKKEKLKSPISDRYGCCLARLAFPCFFSHRRT